MARCDGAEELSRRLTRVFLRDAAGTRPLFGGNRLLRGDPQFRDHLLFHEFFHGDTGEGLGASHQTGWTGLVALLLQPRDKATGCLAFRGASAATLPEWARP